MCRCTSLAKSIIMTFAILYSIQAIIFLIPAIIFAFSPLLIGSYYGASAIFHGIFLVLLIMMKYAFVYEETGQPLSKVNTANIITLSRISAIPVIIFLFFEFKKPWIQFIIFFFIAFIFITDFLDGVVARYCNQQTTIGRYLDSSSDYFLIIFTSIVFFLFNLIPTWLFILILVRLFLLGVGAVIFAIAAKKLAYKVSFLGKASIFSIMTLFLIKLFTKLFSFITEWAPLSVLIQIVEYCVGAILISSFIEKIILIIKEKKMLI
jgi:phosphatidylglycerophosphate synthase